MSGELKLSEHLSKPCVRIGVDASDRESLLFTLAQVAEGAGLVSDHRLFLEHLKQREDEMSTGVGRGLAVPHAEVPGTEDTFVIGATLLNAVEYKSLDSVPVDVVFLIGGKPGAVGLHLQLLARIARLARQPEFLTRLKEQETSEGFLEVIAEAEELLYGSE
ncbi:MAG: PTS sugar transporter subunit IIA [bacterium]